jgi:hypothetical protein
LLGVAGRGSVDPGIVGLALSYALQMTAMFQWTVRVVADTASQMTVRRNEISYITT